MWKPWTIIDVGDERTPVHPGRILKRELAARGLSANRLALALRAPSGRVTDILNGKRGISPETALRLGRFIGNSALAQPANRLGTGPGRPGHRRAHRRGSEAGRGDGLITPADLGTGAPVACQHEPMALVPAFATPAGCRTVPGGGQTGDREARESAIWPLASVSKAHLSGPLTPVRSQRREPDAARRLPRHPPRPGTAPHRRRNPRPDITGHSRGSPAGPIARWRRGRRR